ncbi:MAG TPA: cobalt-precorrin-5B (C(1))-methyltransferase, partial [Rhodospirillales bacterium]|nr:cobalt-precorrin-5B (C(1))-methyltransferase [Rhodospirillales bacterium]
MPDKPETSLPTRTKTALRTGWTTGACATAGAVAAVRALLSGEFPTSVTITLPQGASPTFTLSRHRSDGKIATAGVIKDAGDDPDVTHQAEIVVTVTANDPGQGITFVAGDGVGTVTLPGLPLEVGEPAINPVPRQMIAGNIAAVAQEFSVAADFCVTIAIPGGQKLAKKTMNGRLGIIGGLSILGTTGIVKPYSCAAWIHGIHSGIDVGRAAKLDHMIGATGKTSEAAALALYNLPELALIDMGDFVGGMLKYLRRQPVPRLTIAGGFAKITKLGQGCMDLHSSRSRVDFAKLAALMDDLGAPGDTVEN